MKKILMIAMLVFSILLVVSCAPDEVVEAEAAEEVEEMAEAEVEEEMEEAAEVVEAAAEAEMDSEGMEDGAEELVYASSGDIEIYGYEGFSVEAYTLSVGEPVIFVNMNNEDDPISDVTLTFQSQANTRMFDNSPKILVGESYTHAFDEAGEYLVWTVGYGVKMPITVTE